VLINFYAFGLNDKLRKKSKGGQQEYTKVSTR